MNIINIQVENINLIINSVLETKEKWIDSKFIKIFIGTEADSNILRVIQDLQ